MVQHIYDCKTHEATLVEMTPEEEAAHLALQATEEGRIAALAAAEAQQATEIDAIRAHVGAHPDDPVALLARALGVI